MRLAAREMDFTRLNEQVRASQGDVSIEGCCGQRFIGAGIHDKTITIHGTPGNGLGAYLDGGNIVVHGNVQDAVGDTMNEGNIIVHGSAGDALGYAMRGGNIYLHGDAGYRAGIHMKEYNDKKPVIVIGGGAGSFLGEYLAGGLIIVLGLDREDKPVGNFTGTGMHGGRILIRTEAELDGLLDQVVAAVATQEDLAGIAPYIIQFAKYFKEDWQEIMKSKFYMLMPNAKNPYKQLYAAN